LISGIVYPYTKRRNYAIQKVEMNRSLLSKIAQAEVSAALEELPPPIRGLVATVPIFLEPCPDPGDVERGVEPDTLGIFEEGAATPRIRLWLENIWALSRSDTDVFRQEVRTTLLHEIGHLLGWSEEDVDDRGLG
jgi:predicted Zn-dependent protease with MMP-like domain